MSLIFRILMFLLLAFSHVMLACESYQPFQSPGDASAPDPLPPPVVVSVIPSKGPTNGGTLITVHGKNIQQGANLFIEGKQLSSVEFIDDQRIRGVTPERPGCVGDVDVEIVNPDGQRGKNGEIFRYFYENVELTVTPSIHLENIAARAGALIDVTDDGFLDLIVVHEDVTGADGSPGLVCLMRGYGDGTFENEECSQVIDIFPSDVFAGELDGNEGVDLAVANNSDDCIWIMSEGVGNRFDEIFRIPLEVEFTPAVIEAGDLDQDGDLDLVVSSHRYFGMAPAIATLNVGINRGDGWFDFSDLFYESETFVAGIALGDLDGDGILDIVHSAVGSVFCWFGLGDGSFELGSQFQLTPWPHYMVYDLELADRNGDGFDDLYGVVGENFLQSPDDEGEIIVLDGTGDGHFVEVDRHAISRTPGDLVVTHLDGDDIIDVAVVGQDDSTVTFFKGQSEGIENMGSYGRGPYPQGRLLSGDVNGDDEVDILSINLTDVSSLLNRGNFVFEGQRSYQAGNQPRSVTASDFTGDGVVDLAILAAEDQTLNILPGLGDGTFEAGSVFDVDFKANMMAGFDIDQDSDVELVLLRGWDSHGVPRPIEIIDLVAPGVFETRTKNDIYANPCAFVAGDLDRDGHIDLAVLDMGYDNPTQWERTVGGVKTFRVNGGEGVEEWQHYELEYGGGLYYCLSMGDINEDGWQDLVAGFGRNDELLLLYGIGGGQFEREEKIVDDLPVSCALGDLDGDGHLDLVISHIEYNENHHERAKISFGKGDGSGGFVFETVLDDVWPFISRSGFPLRFRPPVVDVDGDGVSDVLGSRDDIVLRGVEILRFDSNSGEFRIPEYYDTSEFVVGVTAADFDEDGDVDIAAVGDRIQLRILLNGLGTCGK